MKIYRWCVFPLLILIYARLQFAFGASGVGQLYRINDRIAFELHEANQHSNGISIRGYRATNAAVKFVCGACQADAASVDMANAKYRKGDWVYTDYPQHDKAPTDIVNLHTSETINAGIPAGYESGKDLSKLPEYRERELVAADEHKLAQDFVRANFQKLSTFTDRCLWLHAVFAAAALLLLFPRILFWIVEVIIGANNPHDPTNYYSNNN